MDVAELMTQMGWLVAVHIGAGRYGERNEEKYLALMREALSYGKTLIQEEEGGGGGEESAHLPSRAALVASRMLHVFERSELTNAGLGANLTEKGQVECEASVVCGKSKLVAACANLRGVAAPSGLAFELLNQAAHEDKKPCQSGQDCPKFPYGRQAPLVVVGEHARTLARQFGMKTAVSDEDLGAFQVREKPCKQVYERRCATAKKWLDFFSFCAGDKRCGSVLEQVACSFQKRSRRRS